MRHKSVLLVGVALSTGIAMAVSVPLRAGKEPTQTTPRAPESIVTEHENIHAALVALTKAQGTVGTAANELARTLHPHFVREEEIALPPLGLLAPLAAGKMPPGMEEGAALSDSLRKEMPRMLEEHKAIRAATEKLLQAGRQERHLQAQEFAAELALHARTEEEVLYPAAILVGDLIRARAARR